MRRFILLCLCILTGCVAPVPNDDYEVKRCTGIQELAYEEVAYNIENNVDFILYIGRSDCKDCIEFHPLLENYLEENEDLGVYYLDVKVLRDKAFSEDASQEVKDFFENIYDVLEFDWTPTLQHRQGKQIKTSITYLSMDYYDIEDESKKELEKEKNLNEIYEWIKAECK